MITRRLTLVACILAFITLALGSYLRGFPTGSGIIILLGILWIVGIRRRWDWVSPTLFLLLGIFNAILLLIKAPSYLEVISLSATLMTWDLDHFQTRLDRIRPMEMARNVETSHLLRLFISIGAGMLVSAAALLIHIQLSFAIAMIAGAAALITLTQVVNRLARRAGMSTRTTRIQ